MKRALPLLVTLLLASGLVVFRARLSGSQTEAKYVGDETCQQCHEAQWQAFQKSPHGRVAKDGAGVADRVEFLLADAALVDAHGPFDAVFAFECLHDMPHPVDVLAAARGAVSDDGIVVIMDEATEDRFAANASDLERVLYGFSLFVCLPDGRSHTPSAATGTVMRPSTLRGYARAAGWSDIEVLVPEFGLWRFYEIV